VEEPFVTSWAYFLIMLAALLCVAMVGLAMIVAIILIVNRRDRRSPRDGEFRP
jgi:hypothetical protein